MKTKIIKIKGCETCREVVLQLQRTIKQDYVQVIAWHEIDEDEPLIQTSKIKFNHFDNELLMAERYINDFSELSANEYANSFKI